MVYWRDRILIGCVMQDSIAYNGNVALPWTGLHDRAGDLQIRP